MAETILKPQNPPLQFRFGVFFFEQGVVPNPVDIHFQKVSGLSVEAELQEIKEGGENFFSHTLPKRIKHGNLVLERGMVIASPLNVAFNAAMSLFKFLPSNVLITLFDQNSVPIAGWLCMNAYPVKWASSDLDATSNGIMVDTMELAYSRLQIMRL